MDKSVIHIKFETLRRCLARIESKTPLAENELENNLDLQDILSVNLERAVQACVDLSSHLLSQFDDPPPATMVEGFEQLARKDVISVATMQRMKKAVGFRNIAVHEYEKLNWSIVFLIVTKHLQDFRNFAKEINQWIEKQK